MGKRKSLTAFSATKEKKFRLLQQARQSPDLIIFTVLVQRRRVSSRQRRQGTLCSLHVLRSDGWGFKVPRGVNFKSSRDREFWCSAFHHTHTEEHAHCRENLQKTIFKVYFFKRELILFKLQKEENYLSNQTLTAQLLRGGKPFGCLIHPL